MDELIKVWTEVGRQMMEYYRRQNELLANAIVLDASRDENAAVVAPLPTPAVEPKPKRTRKPKTVEMPTDDNADEPIVTEEQPSAKPAAPQAPATFEELATLTQQFVQRFQKSTPDGIIRAKAELAKTYNVDGLKRLPEESRRAFMAWMSSEMEKA